MGRTKIYGDTAHLGRARRADAGLLAAMVTIRLRAMPNPPTPKSTARCSEHTGL
jgi:hypothetical protein